MSASRRHFVLVAGALGLLSCAYGRTYDEALSIATKEVTRFCRDYPRACEGLTGPAEVPSGGESFAFQWTNAGGEPTFLVVVDEKGWAELSFGAGFDQRVLTEAKSR